jgi:Ni/Co efflux regulator RcnB
MNTLKIALAASLLAGTVATAVPVAALADPHDRWEHREDRREHRREDRWDRHHRGGHRVQVCRNVRYHHHWERVCRLEYRRW